MKTRNRFYTTSMLTVLGILLLSACGGGGGPAPTTAAGPSLTFTAVKTFNFSWTDVSDATHYKLLENPDGVSGFTQTGSDISQGTQTYNHIVPLYARINAQYILQSCNTAGCTDSNTISVSGTLVGSIGYFKAGNTDANDRFGDAVSLSADGNTLAVGASGEDSNATGISTDGTGESDNTASAAGAVYVFTRSGVTWTQQAYIKASNTDGGDLFGIAVSLSGDGNTLAVGAEGEDSNATGINGDESDNNAGFAGAIYVFNRSGTSWAQQAYVKASNPGKGDLFGAAVSLSTDSATLAVGAPREDSNATGINQDETDNTVKNAGAVYVFSRSGGTWAQQAYVKASNTDAFDGFGFAVSLSENGNTLAVGAFGEASNATGIGGDQVNNDAGSNAGAVYVFNRKVTTWVQRAYVKASNTGANDRFGETLALSSDGNTLAVGAEGEDSIATGIDGDQSDDSTSSAGAAYVYTRDSLGVWSSQAYVKASSTRANNRFGGSLAISADGNTLAVGADGEDSNATGIGGNEGDISASIAGAAYVFTRNGTAWVQEAYVKASNTDAGDFFGVALALSSDGNTLAVGASGEDSIATGVGGNQGDNSAAGSGAVYFY